MFHVKKQEVLYNISVYITQIHCIVVIAYSSLLLNMRKQCEKNNYSCSILQEEKEDGGTKSIDEALLFLCGFFFP